MSTYTFPCHWHGDACKTLRTCLRTTSRCLDDADERVLLVEAENKRLKDEVQLLRITSRGYSERDDDIALLQAKLEDIKEDIRVGEIAAVAVQAGCKRLEDTAESSSVAAANTTAALEAEKNCINGEMEARNIAAGASMASLEAENKRLKDEAQLFAESSKTSLVSTKAENKPPKDGTHLLKTLQTLPSSPMPPFKAVADPTLESILKGEAFPEIYIRQMWPGDSTGMDIGSTTNAILREAKVTFPSAIWGFHD